MVGNIRYLSYYDRVRQNNITFKFNVAVKRPANSHYYYEYIICDRWLDVPPTYYIGVYESMTHIPDDLVSNADASCRIPTTGIPSTMHFPLLS